MGEQLRCLLHSHKPDELHGRHACTLLCLAVQEFTADSYRLLQLGEIEVQIADMILYGLGDVLHEFLVSRIGLCGRLPGLFNFHIFCSLYHRK